MGALFRRSVGIPPDTVHRNTQVRLRRRPACLTAVKAYEEFGDESDRESRRDHRRREDRNAGLFEHRPQFADHEDERADRRR